MSKWTQRKQEKIKIKYEMSSIDKIPIIKEKLKQKFNWRSSVSEDRKKERKSLGNKTFQDKPEKFYREIRKAINVKDTAFLKLRIFWKNVWNYIIKSNIYIDV